MSRTVPALPHHAAAIVHGMRDKDRLEIAQGWGMEPIVAIRECLAASFWARTLFYELEPMAMYGLAPLSIMGGACRLWMFATAGVERHPFAFARATHRALMAVLERCTLATNLVALDDEPVLKWLDWLGATYVSQPQPRGGRLFAQFILGANREGKRECRRA